MAHQPHHQRDVVRREAHPGGHLLGQDDAGVGVVAGATLAHVVQERADQQEIGAPHRAHEVAGAGNRFEEMPVDGEPVKRVALRLAAHGVPLGEVAHEHAVFVEELHQRHHGVTATEERDERVTRLGRPRIAGLGRLRVESPQRSSSERHAEIRGVGRRSQHQRGVVGRRGVGDHRDLAVTEHQPRRQRFVAPGRRAPARTFAPRPYRAPCFIRLGRDGAPGAAHARHQLVRIGDPEELGDLVLVFQQQAIGSSGNPLQRHPSFEENLDCPPQTLVGTVDVGDGRECTKHRDVTTSATPLLELGLERVRDVTICAVPFLHERIERRESASRAITPFRRDTRDQSLAHLVIAGDDATVEQPQRRLHVGVGDRRGLIGSADAVVEAEPRVPDRVPELVRQRADVAPAAVVVQEHEVEITGRTELAAAVRPDREQRDARLVTQQGGEPRVDHVRCGRAEPEAPEPAVGNETAPGG
jgi:hypothetical protein